MQGRTQRAAHLREVSRTITQRAVNMARREIWRQVSSGKLVNPDAHTTIRNVTGFQPTKIDSDMDQAILRMVLAEEPDARYLSEENESTVYLDEGTLLAWCDPLDGTTNAFTAFSGFAVVLFFEEYAKPRFDHLAGSIASADGTVVSWQSYRSGAGEVWVDWAGDFDWPALTSEEKERVRLDPLSGDKQSSYRVEVGQQAKLHAYRGVPARLAAVAATAQRRILLNNSYDLFKNTVEEDSRDRRWLSTLGGNPYIAPLLLGELGGIIEPRQVKMHDAVYLIPLVLAGGHVYNLETRHELDPLEFFAAQHTLERSIDSFIAVIDPQVLDQLRDTEWEREA
jgi:hypothetical protein